MTHQECHAEVDRLNAIIERLHIDRDWCLAGKEKATAEVERLKASLAQARPFLEAHEGCLTRDYCTFGSASTKGNLMALEAYLKEPDDPPQ